MSQAAEHDDPDDENADRDAYGYRHQRCEGTEHDERQGGANGEPGGLDRVRDGAINLRHGSTRSADVWPTVAAWRGWPEWAMTWINGRAIVLLEDLGVQFAQALRQLQ